MAPNLQMLGLSAGLSVVLSRYAPRYTLGLITTTILLFLFQFLAYQVWQIIIYPRFFSPIRHVPTPPGGGLILGHTKKISRESAGMPMRAVSYTHLTLPTKRIV